MTVKATIKSSSEGKGRLHIKGIDKVKASTFSQWLSLVHCIE